MVESKTVKYWFQRYTTQTKWGFFEAKHIYNWTRMLGIACSMEFDILEWKCHKRHSLLKQTCKRHKILISCNDLIEHKYNTHLTWHDFCGEISEISPNTLSKVAPEPLL